MPADPHKFEQVNEPGGKPIDLKDMIAAANRGPKGRTLTPLEAERAARMAQPPAEAGGDVHRLLELNKAREQESGIGELKPVEKRTSRRTIDLMVLSLVWIAIVIGWVGIPRTTVMLVFEVSVIVFFVAAVWWVIFHVMDKY